MTEKTITEIFNVKHRYLRSANLERDFSDPTALSDYVVTDFTRSCVERLAWGLDPKSGQRAWRITGDYGSGKSSFALLLAQWLSGNDTRQSRKIQDILKPNRFAITHPRFVPVLVTCARQPLAVSILKGLNDSFAQVFRHGAGRQIGIEIARIFKGKEEPTDDQVVELIQKASSRIVADSKGHGILLILDELGKFLEYAALNPHRQDVFLLQRLAEVASRSGDKPIILVCLLHQGFNAYTDQLNQSAQREWEKIAGRFEEIIFTQPIEQIANLIASALDVRLNLIPRAQKDSIQQAMQKTISLGWFGSAPPQSLLEIAPRIYPLHPTVLPILIRLFRRFAQNERSLFSFLLSNEPFGLMTFASQNVRGAELYRLHNLFDYVRTNLGHRITVQSFRSHWNLIDSVIESFTTEDSSQLGVLKTVGVLNLLNDNDLLATEDSIVLATSQSDETSRQHITATLEKLHRGKRVLYDRGRALGYCLWPHSSVDLEKAYDNSRRAVDSLERVTTHIRDYFETRPIVARRHYIETGNLRFYEVRYCPVVDLLSLLVEQSNSADGQIIVPLCETGTEREMAIEFAKSAELKEKHNWLVAISQPLSNLANLVQEARRWEWVATNTPELNADKYAREEVSRQREVARQQLERRLETLLGFGQFNEQTTLEWFHKGKPLKLSDGRQLLSNLSRIFDETYSLAPRIHNELINRRVLSSAAAAARMRLIERMCRHSKAPLLAMSPSQMPPEMSMYLSVLLNTGIHQEQAGVWQICEPHQRKDKGRVLPTLRRIREIVQKNPDSRVSLADLIKELHKPPYGVRDGIIPVLLTVFSIAHEHDVAFYKDGTFQRELTAETILVLSKAPEKFEMQYCKIEGVRAELFDKLLLVLDIRPTVDQQVVLLDVVKSLCVFIAKLPVYVLNTKSLRPTTAAVRDVILNAREPARLLFHELPQACGFEPFIGNSSASAEVRDFIKTLKGAIDDLRAAFPELQGRMRAKLQGAFDIQGSFQQFRSTLSSRSELVLLGITESRLRALCLRLMDDSLSESDWLESLGSQLALKPPSKWHDFEEDLFNQELSQIAVRFHRVESIVFGSGKQLKNSVGIRLSITRADGTEHEQIVHVDVEEERQIRDLQIEFENLLTDGNRLAVAAASRALWAQMEKRRKGQE